MTEPAAEQIKKFWEWCGFRLDYGMWYSPVKDSLGREHGRIAPPELDLNNLFKYAVPKMEAVTIECDNGQTSVRVIKLPNVFYAVNKDPALALFWAIWEVIHKESL